MSQTQTPLDVPASKRSTYQKNFNLITKGTGRLFLFAGDQRVEHLNDDFFGPGIATDDATPEHLFKIAAASRVGVFATQMGLIARYGRSYPKLPYAVKLNGKSNLRTEADGEPYSAAWYDVRQVVEFARESGLTIPAVGYTVYVGSAFEAAMLREAAQIVYEAHKAGLVVILWMYPRGEAVEDKFSAHTIAGAVNVGSALGADFLKINRPAPATHEGFKEIMLAGQATNLIFAGGDSVDQHSLLNDVANQLRAGAHGVALGRNLHQRPLNEAVATANAVAGIIYDVRI